MFLYSINHFPTAVKFGVIEGGSTYAALQSLRLILYLYTHFNFWLQSHEHLRILNACGPKKDTSFTFSIPINIMSFKNLSDPPLTKGPCAEPANLCCNFAS